MNVPHSRSAQAQFAGRYLLFDPGPSMAVTACTLLCNGAEILLTPRETDLLCMLHRAPSRYLDAYQLAAELHLLRSGAAHLPLVYYRLEQTVSRLRQKPGEAPHHPRLLRCRRGVGYALFPSALEPVRWLAQLGYT
jgi:DNA-binding response OmpR family regulator